MTQLRVSTHLAPFRWRLGQALSRKRFTIPARIAGASVSLADVLSALGLAHVIERTWRTDDMEVAGNPSAADELRAVVVDRRTISGQRLVEVARAGVQIVDGTLTGTSSSGTDDLLVHAIDSSHWDVEGDEDAIGAFRGVYPMAEEVPD